MLYFIFHLAPLIFVLHLTCDLLSLVQDRGKAPCAGVERTGGGRVAGPKRAGAGQSRPAAGSEQAGDGARGGAGLCCAVRATRRR